MFYNKILKNFKVDNGYRQKYYDRDFHIQQYGRLRYPD